MTPAQMIQAIINAIQTDENVIILLRGIVTVQVNNPNANLPLLCQILNINTSGSGD